MAACDAFTGLPDGAETKYTLIRMVERAARPLGLGFTDIRILTLYVGYTRAQDWAPGARPVYTRPVWRTASDLGISARQVNRSETRLERLGLLFRDTRADGARGTVREADRDGGEGRVIHCIDLRPLAVAWPMLTRIVEAARNREAAIDAARAGISRALRLVPRLLAEAMAVDGTRAEEAGLTALRDTLPPRTPRHRDLPRLVALHARMCEAVEALKAFLTPVDNGDNPAATAPMADDPSDAADGSVSDIINTDKGSVFTCRAEKDDDTKAASRIGPDGRTASANPDPGDVAQTVTGLERLPTRCVIEAMPESWRFAMAGQGRFTWRGFCHVAESRLRALDVGVHAWRRLSLVTGRRAAAIALMALEANREHPGRPVRNVGGAVFRFAEIAQAGGLRLDAMVLGIVARQGRAGGSTSAGNWPGRTR